MPFDIVDFSSKISKRGFQKTSHYEVIITPPTLLTSSEIVSDIPFRANSVNIPGITLDSDNIKHKGYGLSEKRANGANFSDLAITFIVDGHGELPKFFLDWMELIHPTDEETYGVDGVEFLEYPVNYYGGVDINVFDSTGVMHTTYSFKDPFPIAIGDVQHSWETTDSILILPVSFAFRSFKQNPLNKGMINQI